MREILFRGKRCDNGEWAQGFYVRADHHWHKNGIHKDWIICGASANGGWFALHNKYAVKAGTVGQFTGLIDKNDNKIFEGDIVVCRKEICGNWIDCCVEIGFVEMKHGAFGLHRKQGYYRPFKDWLEDYEYEVIGNIHDNPDMTE